MVPRGFAAVSFGEIIDQDANLQGQVACWRVQDVDAHGPVLEVSQQWPDGAAPQSGTGEKTWHAGDAEAGLCRRKAGVDGRPSPTMTRLIGALDSRLV